jgi:hypothetical protein
VVHAFQKQVVMLPVLCTELYLFSMQVCVHSVQMVAMQIMCRELYVISVYIPTLCWMVSHLSLCTHFVQNGSLFVSLYTLCTKWFLNSLSVPTLYKIVSHFSLCTHFVQNGITFLSLCTHFVQNGITFLSLYPLCTKWYVVSICPSFFWLNSLSLKFTVCKREVSVIFTTLIWCWGIINYRII